MLDHIDENVEYELEITGVFRDALTRQANESVRIYGRKGSEILNSKSEFNHPPTARVVVEKKQKYENKAKQAQVCNTHVINNWSNYPFFLVVKVELITNKMAK